ncbi:hypothetical protein AAFM79_10540 [Trichormus azollae HNT15244]
MSKKIVEGNFDRLPKVRINLVIFKSIHLIIFFNIHIVEKILGITNHQFQDLLAQAEIQNKRIQAEIESKKIPINQK